MTPPKRSRRELAEIEHLLTDTVSLTDQLQRMTDRLNTFTDHLLLATETAGGESDGADWAQEEA